MRQPVRHMMMRALVEVSDLVLSIDCTRLFTAPGEAITTIAISSGPAASSFLRQCHVKYPEETAVASQILRVKLASSEAASTAAQSAPRSVRHRTGWGEKNNQLNRTRRISISTSLNVIQWLRNPVMRSPA